MKKLLSIPTYLLFSLLFTGVIFQSCSKNDPEPEPEPEPETIQIPNEQLRSLVLAGLGLPATTVDIPLDKMEDLVSINANDLETVDRPLLDDLTGLEHATNLIYLRIGETGVTDLSPVSGLENIRYFRINDTEISDLTPISNYTKLVYFNANSATQITDISPLAGNVDLLEAILRNVPFGNEGMETIGKFTKLYRLNMRNTGVSDITVLGELMANGEALLSSNPYDVDDHFPDELKPGKEQALDLRENPIESYDPIRPFVENGTAVETSPSTLPAN
ncbi:hypothetical protein SAMN05421747_10148 [Parapedobacter composti]|uniref:Leucine Rich repeat-containing protein n=1 Tax=Parapedobacter composti TaxID=623281 RepID=A0A1I1DSG1_9SPHI|nr:hypothetical protein [Parapedobacter composti]SFB77831.1 hypothetical protein SAMN05421747_10148 [Parapedobacter composti]